MISIDKPNRGISIPSINKVSITPIDHGLFIRLGLFKSPGFIFFIHEKNPIATAARNAMQTSKFRILLAIPNKCPS